jgi:hypothetical protein
LPPGPTASGRLTGRPLVLLKCKMPWRGCGLCQSLVIRDFKLTPPASRKLNSRGKFRVASLSDRDRGSLRPRSRRRPTVTRLSEELRLQGDLNRAVTPSPGSCQRLGLTRSATVTRTHRGVPVTGTAAAGARCPATSRSDSGGLGVRAALTARRRSRAGEPVRRVRRDDRSRFKLS